MVLLAKIDGRQNTWGYYSWMWTSSGTYNADSLAFDETEAKLEAFRVALGKVK